MDHYFIFSFLFKHLFKFSAQNVSEQTHIDSNNSDLKGLVILVCIIPQIITNSIIHSKSGMMECCSLPLTGPEDIRGYLGISNDLQRKKDWINPFLSLFWLASFVSFLITSLFTYLHQLNSAVSTHWFGTDIQCRWKIHNFLLKIRLHPNLANIHFD